MQWIADAVMLRPRVQLVYEKWISKNLSLALHLGVQALVLVEVIFPVLLVFGLATRIATSGMIALTTVIDIYARHAPPEVIGALFDARPYDMILDLRLLWITVFAIPAVLGGCGLSLQWEGCCRFYLLHRQ